MSTITTTVPDDTAGKIKRNAEIALKSLSSYVVILASALAAVWLGLTEAQQAAFVAAHPVLTPLAPYLAAAAWVVAKLAPQNMVLSADKEAMRRQAVDWLHQILAATASGQVVTVPPTVAKALGMSVPVVVVPPPTVDTLTQVSPVVVRAPDPLEAQHVDLSMPLVSTPASAVTTQVAATLGDAWAALQQQNPGMTQAEIAGIVQAALMEATLPKPSAVV